MPRTPPSEIAVTLHRLHPCQRRIVENGARFKVVMCGRRFGKTAVAIRWLCDGALAGEPVAYMAPSYKFALEAWRELVQRLKPITSRISEQDKRIELMTGGVVEVWTLDGDDPARGRKYARVVIDEAGIVRELLDLWQQAIRPTLVDLAGQALILGTPKGRRHGFVTLFNRGQQPDEAEWASFRASTLENPYIPAEEVEAARNELPPEVFQQEFEGIPTDDGANPFGLDAVRNAIGPLSIHPPVVYGLDLARSSDYTVLVGMDAWRRTTSLERWQSPWGATKERVRDTVGMVPVVADATGVGDAIVADLDQMGVDVTPHVFTQPSKLRLMQRLVTAFQGKELTIPDGWLVGELEAFEFEYTANGVKYCMDKNTRVLTADAKWVPIGSVSRGQELFGFDEHRADRRRSWKKAVVVDTAVTEKPCYRLRLSDGTELICSADHQWLVDHGNGPQEWRTTEQLRPVTSSRSPRDAPSRLVRLLPVWEEEQTYCSGYMAGVMDGEGSINQARRKTRETGSVFRLAFAQRDNELLHFALESLEAMGVRYTVHGPAGTNNDVWQVGITGGMPANLSLLGRIQPKRLLAKFDIDKLGTISTIETPHVVEKEFLGIREVVAVETTTRTFVAEGLASHNCAPKGLHDDGVMGLALALYGWDRVQGVPPDDLLPLQNAGDDTMLRESAPHGPAMVGAFTSQLPAGGW
jgi:hypothetical protein